MESALSHLECALCHRTYDADRLMNVCECSSPLLPRYDLDTVKRSVTRADLAGRPANMWRYRELLPVRNRRNVISLGEGFTPLYRLDRLGKALGLAHLYVKDESGQPGGTFKARGAATGVSRALELGASTIAIPTNGNAGEAWALYGARAGLETVVIMPVDSQVMPQKICTLAGARLYLVRGLISDAGKLVQRGVQRHGWFEVSTLKEPYRIEGKKTMGYEIAEQLGWDVPDVILCPSGGGMAIAAIVKAFQEMRELGWVPDRMPRMICIQAAGCEPLVRAFHAGATSSTFFEGAQTFANGLRVPKSIGDFMVLKALRETGGTAISVTDGEILSAVSEVGRQEGLFLCPEAAAVLPALRKLLDSGVIKPEERIVWLGTGSGLKYPDTVDAAPPVLDRDSEL